MGLLKCIITEIHSAFAWYRSCSGALVTDAYLNEAIDCVHFGILLAPELVVRVVVLAEEEVRRTESAYANLITLRVPEYISTTKHIRNYDEENAYI